MSMQAMAMVGSPVSSPPTSPITSPPMSPRQRHPPSPYAPASPYAAIPPSPYANIPPSPYANFTPTPYAVADMRPSLYPPTAQQEQALSQPRAPPPAGPQAELQARHQPRAHQADFTKADRAEAMQPRVAPAAPVSNLFSDLYRKVLKSFKKYIYPRE